MGGERSLDASQKLVETPGEGGLRGNIEVVAQRQRQMAGNGLRGVLSIRLRQIFVVGVRRFVGHPGSGLDYGSAS